MSNFSAYSKYYDLLYRDKDYSAEVDYVHRLLEQHHPGCKQVLELGSGTGKHAKLLSQKGYILHGVERSSTMVDIARQSPSEHVTFEVADIRNFTATTKYDAAISLFHVISYLSENDELIQTFRNISGSLTSNGIFIFDVWYSPAVYFQHPETRIKRLDDDTVQITRLAEPVMHHRTNTVDVNYEVIIRDKLSDKVSVVVEKHPMRHFSEPEIKLLAAATGFKLLQAEEFLTANTPDTGTWGVCFILQKQ